MDPLTHGLVGALTAQSITRHRKIRPTLITGFFAALLADLDTFIHSSSDPLLNVEIHRQFTHALVFIPVGALVAAILMFWFQRRHLSFTEVYIISFIGYATSGLLDAFTSYGTQLLWPFSDARIAWNIVSVVDPVITIGLLVAFFMLFRPERHIMGPPRGSGWAYAGLAWLGFFLIIGFAQLQRAKDAAYDIARERSHIMERVVVKPTLGNRVLWRSTYVRNDTVYADGIRLTWFGENVYYQGDAQPLVRLDTFDEIQSTTQFNDIKRFYHLSDGFLIRHPDQADVIGDARYAMLPTSLIPLWGIRLDSTDTNAHVGFAYFRDASSENRSTLWTMLRARELD
ncbi:MAG: metal-dependent hydrolase [Bacteroidetes bacterium]|nr:metal-dependent hydrolase [Bacteroidota bacterium]MCH8524335.1 metal-dependent hydrolase [Balneolales bacterium]